MFSARSKSIMPVKSWLTSTDAYVGLLLSSFVINLLGLVFPVCVLQFYDRVIPHKSYDTLAAMVLLVLGAFAFETVFKIMRAYVSSWSGARFTYNMGKDLFNHVIETDLSDFEKNTAGVYLDKYNSSESLKEYYSGQNLIMLVDMPFVVIYVLLMFMINKYTAMVPAVVIAVMFMNSRFTNNETLKQLNKKNKTSEIKSKFLIEMIAGIHTIKSLGMEAQFIRRYERLHRNEIINNYELIQKLSESSRSANLYSQLAVIFTVSLGGLLVMKHHLSVGGLAASILLVGKIMQPVAQLISYLEKKQNLSIAIEDYQFLTSFKPEYKAGLIKLESLQGNIELQNVSFKYHSSDKFVLKNINLNIKANETVVIHGEGFSGKSTLMLLICSLFKPTEGNILIDGNNLNNVDLEALRRRIAYMPDSGELFTGTIMENLTLFETDEYGEEAKQIAKSIGLHDIIESMPHSYNTEVGTGTVDLLSKGHKQQILIVRSLLNNPKIILFDEANVSLDIDSDIKLRKYLISKKGTCTMILITHRPSLLEMADKHYKLEDGKLMEFKWQ